MDNLDDDLDIIFTVCTGNKYKFLLWRGVCADDLYGPMGMWIISYAQLGSKFYFAFNKSLHMAILAIASGCFTGQL